ncbi:MAG: roadblock/LC7 domain-containing protein [Myxococcota bacterium]
MVTTNTQRHWLASQLDQLDALARERDRRAGAASRGEVDEASARLAREDFLRALDTFVLEVATREGVVGCVVGHEGLVLASGGTPPDADTLAAVGQVWLDAATQGAGQLGLGGMSQLVVIGDQYKVALFQTGGMSIAILAHATAELASVLARG